MDAADNLEQMKSAFVPEPAVETLDNFSQTVEGLLKHCFPKPKYQSVSFEIEEELCNICGLRLMDCDHKLGEYYGDKRCRRQLNGLSMREVSFVDKPRDRGCVLLEMDDKGLCYSFYSGTNRPSERSSDETGFHAHGIITRVTEPSDPREWKSLLPELDSLS